MSSIKLKMGKGIRQNRKLALCYVIVFMVALAVLIISVKEKTQKNQLTGSATVALCQPDCTYTYDSLCHSECDRLANCSFFGNVSKSICDNKGKDFRLKYNETHEVQCCTGSPYVPVKEAANTEVKAENWVRIVKNLWFEGRIIKLVIDVFH